MIRKRMDEKAGVSSNNNNNYGNNNNQNRSSRNSNSNTTNVILIVSGVILFIVIAVMVFLTMKNMSVNSSDEKRTQSEDNFPKVTSPSSGTTPENNENTTPPVDTNHETINGYTYLKDDGKNSTFSKRSLGYEQTLIGVEDQYQPYMDIKSEYCNAVNEIEKVDKGIVPGTNTPFSQATYTQVDDAYREYLQQIAQIRQVVILAIANEDMENEVGCYYKGTHWNNANSQYKAKQFYNDEIDNYYNSHRN